MELSKDQSKWDMSRQAEIWTVLAANSIPVGMNLAQVSDALTALAAVATIGFTIFRFYIDLKKNKKENDKEETK